MATNTKSSLNCIQRAGLCLATCTSKRLHSRTLIGFCLGIWLMAGPLRSQTVSVTQTTGDQSRLLATLPQTGFGTGGSGSYMLQVDDSRTYQQWDGVGAAMTDSSNWLIWDILQPSQRDDLMRDLFTPAGAGLDIIRMPMGASDFSASGDYSYDDLSPGQTDPDLSHFSIAHDLPSTIPAAQAAFAVNQNLKIFALPWSPPAWMKSSSTMRGGGFNTQYGASLANYFVKFIQSYQQANLPIYAISVQNEPLNSTSHYPSMGLSSTDEGNFIVSSLAPALQSAGLGAVKVLAYEHNWDTPSYPATVLASAGDAVAGSAWHCYSDISGEGAERQISNQFPGKGIWFTECTEGRTGDFAGDLRWNSEHLLMTNSRNGGKSVIEWNIALDENGGPINGSDCLDQCVGLVTIDRTTSPATIRKNHLYYVLAQVGRFVRPGAYNVATDSQGGGGVQSVGFKNPDGTLALVVFNGGSAQTTVTVVWHGSSFDYAVPAGSLTTFTWPGV